jgi:hypothetical protein
MGLGGAYGTGTVFEKGEEIGTTTLKQASMGFEFGGEVYREIIFFGDKETLHDFKGESSSSVPRHQRLH